MSINQKTEKIKDINTCEQDIRRRVKYTVKPQGKTTSLIQHNIHSKTFRINYIALKVESYHVVKT